MVGGELEVKLHGEFHLPVTGGEQRRTSREDIRIRRTVRAVVAEAELFIIIVLLAELLQRMIQEVKRRHAELYVAALTPFEVLVER